MKDTLNIAMAVPYVPPTYIGGGETYIYHLSRELARLDVNISLFAARLPADTGEWDWRHVDLHQCRPLFKVGNTPVMPSLPFQMLNNGHYQLIHTAVPSGYTCDVSALVSGLRKIPLVVTYHCDLVNQTAVSRAYGSILKNHTLRRAGRVIATTDSYARTSSLLGQMPDKVTVVPMGTSLSGYSPQPEDGQEIKARYGIKGGEKVALFVGGLGSFHRFKRVDLLIGAMAKVLQERADVSLIIVGRGNLMPQLKTQSQALGLKKVHFAGYVTNEELPKYYAAADLFVLPSLTREEAFGIVMAEAASCGAVPMCFDIPGPGEVCRDLGGFVVPLSQSDEAAGNLAQAILSVFSQNLSHRSAACRVNAKRYAWSEIARQTLETYKELLSG